MKKRLSNEEQRLFKYMIQMLASAVNGTQPVFPPENTDWEKLLKLSILCGVQAMFADSALRLPNEAISDRETLKALKSIRDAELFTDSLLCFEAERLLKSFDENQIKNMPVKGYFMKQEYPRSDFRSVSDFDILFDSSQANQVKSVFAELGYTFEFNDDNQYHFKKKPGVYIEMHTSLVHKYEPSYPLLFNQLDKGTKRKSYQYSYEMSFDDHYIYMLVHNSNHFRIGGLSIRMVLDTYIYHKNHRMDFDYDYINSKLKLLGLEKFEQR